MTAPTKTDRLTVALVGLVLVAVSLALLDWRFGWVLSWGDTLDTAPVDDVLATSWWPWASAVVGVLLGLLGLAWGLAHLRPASVPALRLPASGPEGRLEVDLRSLAHATAARLESLAPVTGLSGTARTHRGSTVVELRGRVEETAEVHELRDAVTTVTREVEQAFPAGDVAVRVVLDSPKATRRERTDRVRVQ